MRAPAFWSRPPGVASRLLAPAGAVYAAATAARLHRSVPVRMAVPVISVGNLVAGGTGKTPVVLDLLARLGAAGVRAQALTRGYRGRLAGPVRVDLAAHDAGAVGDEALLLAARAPTWVARDRRLGARAAVADGAAALVLDDAHQSPGLVKDLALVVVDGEVGFGNGAVVPAGPLREPVSVGLARADAVAVLGDDRAGVGTTLAAAGWGGRPVWPARLVPDRVVVGAADDAAGDRPAGWLEGRDVLAFAGIGRPEKFFQTLVDLGARVVAHSGFPDHHRYRPDEVMAVVEDAVRRGARPVTTAKDWVRLPAAARAMVSVVTVRIAWDAPGEVVSALGAVVAGRGG